MSHPWPGNIRQLKNVIANAVILSDGEEISGLENGDGETAGEEISIDKDLHTTVAHYAREFERRIIRSVLQQNNGNISKSAVRLGISRKTLYEKIRRHDLGVTQ